MFWCDCFVINFEDVLPRLSAYRGFARTGLSGLTVSTRGKAMKAGKYQLNSSRDAGGASVVICVYLYENVAGQWVQRYQLLPSFGSPSEKTDVDLTSGEWCLFGTVDVMFAINGHWNAHAYISKANSDVVLEPFIQDEGELPPKGSDSFNYKKTFFVN